MTTPPNVRSLTTFAAFKAAERAREERHTLAVERRVLGLVETAHAANEATWAIASKAIAVDIAAATA